MYHRLSRIFVIAISLVALTNCSSSNTGIEVTQLPQRIDYRCSNNKVLQIKRAPDASAVAVLINEKVVTLPRADSATQEKYTDGIYSLYLQGERAMLEKNSQMLFGPCNAGPLPKKTIDGFDER